MALSPGTQVGQYAILSLLGRGGMGEVYRARDQRLDRNVAIKVLPESFATDPERIARFEREAKTLAALNHPNIAHIHGLEESNGIHGLVMELVEGPTLADRIAKGPLPLDEALPIAKQIADALEAAHEQGIIHRDLKPANIKVREDGTVKVLDFGLAKALEPTSLPPGDLTQPPTVLSPSPTLAGVILGTAAYMSPEQAAGKPVDKRSDVWAFGVVLMEMLTGRPVFTGETVSHVLAAVLRAEPDWTTLPANAPALIQRLLRHCLEKDRRRRLDSAADARLEIEEALTVPSGDAAVGRSAPVRGRWFIAAASVVVIGSAVAAFATWALTRPARRATEAVVRLAVALPQGEQSVAGPPMALSPDAAQLAYVSKNQLFLRVMSSLDIKAITGTEGARGPFFSPDGQWIGFFAQSKLKKVSTRGGLPQILADAKSGMGGCWGPDDTIYFAPSFDTAIWRISASGGQPQSVTALDRNNGEVSHRWPQILPGGKALVFTVWTGPGWDERHLHLHVIGTSARRLLVQGASTGRYVSSGHLVYSRAGGVLAVPFDLTQLAAPTSSPVPLDLQVREVAQGAELALSDNGSLAYVPGTSQGYASRLVWVDRRGVVEPLPTAARAFEDLVISPDGRQVAVSIKGGTYGIWIYDFSRATFTPLTTKGSAQDPFWTPDGLRIVYRETQLGLRNLFEKPADGTGIANRLTSGAGVQTVGSISRDGKWLAFTQSNVVTGTDVWIMQLQGNRTPRAFLNTPFNESNPRFSPNGEWIAYTSNDSGQDEVYVRPFPNGGAASRISTDGGSAAVWSHDGRELFYLNGNKMMVVDIRTRPSFVIGSPKLLFEGRYTASTTGSSGYDVSADGRRFLRMQPIELEQVAQINVVLNWPEELKGRVPTK